MTAKTCSNKQSSSRNSRERFLRCLEGKGKHQCNMVRVYGATLTSYVPQEEYLYELYWVRQAEVVYLGDNSTQLFQERRSVTTKLMNDFVEETPVRWLDKAGERDCHGHNHNKIGEIIAHCTAENHLCKLGVTGCHTHYKAVPSTLFM